MRLGHGLPRLRQPILSSAAITASTTAPPALLAQPTIAAAIAAASITAAISSAAVASASIAAPISAAISPTDPFSTSVGVSLLPAWMGVRQRPWRMRQLI